MEDPKFESEIPVAKSEKGTIVHNQADNLHSVIDALNRSDSEADSPEFVEEIQENVRGVQKYSSLDSTTEKILPDDSTHDLNAVMKYLSLEHEEDNNNRNFDDQKDINSRNIRVKNSVDVHQTKLCKNLKYDSSMSSSGKNEFDNRTRESSDLDAKAIEDIFEDHLNKCTSSPIEVKSPIPSINTDKYLKVNEECSCDNSKKESADRKSEQVQPLKTESPKIERRNTVQFNIEVIIHENNGRLKTGKRNSKSSSKCHRVVSTVDARQDLDALLGDNQIAGLRKRVDQTCGKTMQLSGQILLKGRSQTYQMQTSTIPSKDKKKTGSGLSGIRTGFCSKNQVFSTKIMTKKVEESKCLNESRCEAEVHPSNLLLNTENWAAVQEEPVAAKEIKLLESNPTNTGLTDVSRHEDVPMGEVNVPLDAAVGVRERVTKELMSENFTSILKKLTSDSLYTKKKCLESLGHLGDVVDKDITVNSEKLLKHEITDFKPIKKKLADVTIELHEFKEWINVISPETLALKPGLKDTLCDYTQFLYSINSSLYTHFKSILEKLREMDEGIVIKGSKENRLKKVIAEFVEVMEWMNERTYLMEEMIKVCFEKKFY